MFENIIFRFPKEWWLSRCKSNIFSCRNLKPFSIFNQFSATMLTQENLQWRLGNRLKCAGKPGNKLRWLFRFLTLCINVSWRINDVITSLISKRVDERYVALSSLDLIKTKLLKCSLRVNASLEVEKVKPLFNWIEQNTNDCFFFFSAIKFR